LDSEQLWRKRGGAKVPVGLAKDWERMDPKVLDKTTVKVTSRRSFRELA